MRCAVPSSKVGSCDSASACAERDSGVDAAPALGAAPRTGFAATLGFAGAALAGFAGACAAGGAVVFELWPSAGTLTSIVAMALIVILRIREILGKTRG